MYTPRKTRSARARTKETFEKSLKASLKAQDRMLERLDARLESPVLNGGFETMVEKVDKIETVTAQLSQVQATSCEKIDAIHTAIYDPETGLYVKTKENTMWIQKTSKGFKWILGIIVAAAVTGAAKLIFDFLSTYVR